MENIFVLHFSETPASFFFSSSGKVFFKDPYPYFRVVETDFRANNGVHKKKKAVNKIILFPITEIVIPQARRNDSLKRYVFTTPKSCHQQKNNKKKSRKKWFQIVGERHGLFKLHGRPDIMHFAGKNTRPRYQCLFNELPNNVFKYTIYCNIL